MEFKIPFEKIATESTNELSVDHYSNHNSVFVESSIVYSRGPCFATMLPMEYVLRNCRPLELKSKIPILRIVKTAGMMSGGKALSPAMVSFINCCTYLARPALIFGFVFPSLVRMHYQ